ncbi:MAG TPA: alpha/beta fold hydrolase [Acidimicrobiales bacterium]|nr:alpha/beta fold hydrolase [Acidimicrobiales bacterium]
MSAPIMAGAEPESIDGGPNGALVLHGFTGNCNSMRGIAHALARAGFTVELPLLPGHGTTVEDMNATTWSDWSAAAEETLEKLQARVDEADGGGKVVVVGLSMGGSLTAWLGTRHPELAGLAFINPAVTMPAEMRDGAQALLDSGTEYLDGIGSDIADPDSTETAYEKTPVKPLLSLLDAEHATHPHLRNISCPSLIITSRQDHVVPPENSDDLAGAVSGPVERIWLERSYHVATLDFDKADVEQAVVDFAKRVTS